MGPPLQVLKLMFHRLSPCQSNFFISQFVFIDFWLYVPSLWSDSLTQILFLFILLKWFIHVLCHWLVHTHTHIYTLKSLPWTHILPTYTFCPKFLPWTHVLKIDVSLDSCEWSHPLDAPTQAELSPYGSFCDFYCSTCHKAPASTYSTSGITQASLDWHPFPISSQVARGLTSLSYPLSGSLKQSLKLLPLHI